MRVRHFSGRRRALSYRVLLLTVTTYQGQFRPIMLRVGLSRSYSVPNVLPRMRTYAAPAPGVEKLPILRQLEKKIIWLSTWTIHHANNVRESRDGLKVGGHQASSTSLSTIMTALYLGGVLQPHDRHLRTRHGVLMSSLLRLLSARVAVKPHASPILHSIQYLLGKQTLEQLERFRAFGGMQSYPSITKDSTGADVDFSTGSVGLGVATANFAALFQDFLELRGLTPAAELRAESTGGIKGRTGRMIGIVGVSTYRVLFSIGQL